MEACGHEGRGPTWAVASTRRSRINPIYLCHRRSHVSRPALVVTVFLYGFLTRFRISVFLFDRDAR
jgi:hypothetical protein